MSKTLKSLWQDLIDVGFNVRKNHMDGLKEWQPYKAEYANYVLKDHETGIPLKKKFIDFSNSLNYKFTDENDHQDVILNIEDKELHNVIDTNHFFIQHFRIPRLAKYNLSVLKILQLAYNVGQLKAVFELEDVFGNEVKKFYYSNNLNKLSTYVDRDIRDSMVIKRTANQTGSSANYHKYLKYKRKYLRLKQTG